MAAGVEPIKEYCEEEAQKLHKSNQEIHKEIDIIKECLTDTIDCISMNDDERAKFINETKSRLKHSTKPANYNIKIIVNKNIDEELAENLRKSLNKQGNSAYTTTYAKFKKELTGTSEYNIFIQDSEKLITEKTKQLFSAYGCSIYLDNHNLIVTYNGKIDDYDREQFIKYYTMIVGSALQIGKNAHKAEKALKKRKNTKEIELTSTMEKIMDWAENIQDNALDISDSMLKFGVFGLLPAAITAIVGSAFSIGILLLDIPFGLSEMAMKSVINGLKNKEFDSKFVAEAQRQILEIKICEFISTEQIKNAR